MPCVIFIFNRKSFEGDEASVLNKVAFTNLQNIDCYPLTTTL